MADDVQLPGAGATIATDEVAGRHFQIAKIAFGEDGTATPVSGADPLPVEIQGTLPVAGPLTDGELRAGPISVSGPVTDAQMRAAPVPVSDGGGALTVDGTVGISGTVPVSGPLTDAQLRATAVSTRVSGRQSRVMDLLPADGGGLPGLTVPITSGGAGITASGGGISVQAGTAEFGAAFMRATAPVTVPFRVSVRTGNLSPNYANNNLEFLLAEVIGEGLAYSIVSPGIARVTAPGHGIPASRELMGVIAAGVTGGGVDGDFYIEAIVDADTLDVAVFDWPGSGSGTLTLLGGSILRTTYGGTSPTRFSVGAANDTGTFTPNGTGIECHSVLTPGHLVEVEATATGIVWRDAPNPVGGDTDHDWREVTDRYGVRAGLAEGKQFYFCIWSHNYGVPAGNAVWSITGIALEQLTTSIEVSNPAAERIAAQVLARLPVPLAVPPPPATPATPVREVGQDSWACSFSEVGASVLSPEFVPPVVTLGMSYAQAAGALAVSTGTAARAEFFTRSARAFTGAQRLRVSTVLSQRIANQNFQVILGDLIGENLAFSLVNTTTMDVALPGHGFTAQNVGQAMFIGGIVLGTAASAAPGVATIASIPNGDTLRLTVPATAASTGTGTCTLFGHSCASVLYTGTTATTNTIETRRKGWSSGSGAVGFLTSASPGHIAQIDLSPRDCFFADALRASATTPNFTTRGSRYEALPDPDKPLYLFIWAWHTTAPASTTTWTIGFAANEVVAPNPVIVHSVRTLGTQNPIPVSQQGTVALSALPAGTNNIGAIRIVPDVGQGASTFHRRLLAVGTNLTSAKNAAGNVNTISLHNDSATKLYVKFYNKASAPVLASDTPVMTIPVPANSAVQIDCGPFGIRFSAGIAYAVTGGIADTDVTAVAANDGVINLVYT